MRVEGYRLGVSFRRKIRIGGGISWLKTPLEQTRYAMLPDGSFTPVSEYLMFFYFSYYIDFVFYKTTHWQLSTPLQFGAGWYWWQNRPYSFYRNIRFDHFLYLYEPGIAIQYKFFPFVGLGMDVCYRFGDASSGFLKHRFHSPSYGVKLLFWIHQLYFYLFPKSELTRKYGPASW